MIGRIYRFHGRASIGRLHGRSQVVRQGVMSLKYALRTSGNPRIAVVVSRKVSKSAVVRNRIRRRVYENVRILFSSFSVPFDLVFVVYDEKIAEQPAAKLTSDIEKLLTKAGVTSATSSKRAIMEPKE